MSHISVGNELTDLTMKMDSWEENTSPPATAAKHPQDGYETEPPADEATLGHVWHGFSQDTTFHGVRFVTMHQAGFSRRLLWAFVILAASFYLIYQIQDRINYFLSEPILVSVAITFNDTLRFPSIAICNQNQFRFTAAVDRKYSSYLEQIFNNHDLQSEITLGQLNSSAMNKTFTQNPSKVGIVTRSKQTYERFLGETWENLQTSLGHQVEDMIMRCHFSSEKCSAKDFQAVMTDHGLCYKFKGLNRTGEGYELPYALEAGSREGLNLLLNVESYEYSPGEHESAGFKVVLLDPGDIPMIRSQGEGVGPGTYTFVALKPEKTVRITSRSTRCIQKSRNLSFFDLYTEMACHENCKAKAYLRDHGCRKTSRWNNYDEPSTPLCTVAMTMSLGDDLATNFTTNQTASTDKLEDSKTQSCRQSCLPRCQTMDYDTSFSFLKTAENDINQLDQEVLKKILNDNAKARDYRINTDELRYKEYLDAIKEFKAVTRDTAKVYGSAFADSVENNNVKFRRETSRCHISLNETATYFSKMFDFYNQYFYGPAAGNFPDVTSGTRSLIRNVEEALRPTVDANFKKSVEFEIVSARIALKDSMVALEEILYKYGNYTPVVPDTNITDYNNTVGFGGIYMTKPLKNVVLDTGTNKLTDEYYEIATKNVNFLKSLALEMSNEKFVNAGKQRFLDDMSKLSYIRRNLIERFQKPSLVSEWISATLLKTIGEAETIGYTMLSDMFGHFYNFVTNSAYDNWVASLSESGFLNVSIYAKVAHKADSGPLEKRFSSIVVKMHQHLIESFQRFSRLETNFKLYEKKVSEASNTARSNIEGGVPESQLRQLLGILELSSCSYIGTSNKGWWFRYFPMQKEAIKKVQDLILSRFEKLKSLLLQYIGNLDGDGIFYKENFVAVDVFFKEMSYQTVKQTIAYDVTALLSDIGGSMGLLIGGSCLTVCELIDTIAFSIAVFWARRAKTNVQKAPRQQKAPDGWM
ncbi:uncharacterized protein LOC135487906 [Lineus longissimus]|uniref:uncharacterized protein LOC135487906 n=1 Tax=Lineus longissimus TaxID=88925 RepID=UPI002B4C2C67